MLVSVLASSSKGNSVYIKTKHHELLIDAGMNAKYLEEKLKENETSLKNIDYILITHTHSDHVSALNTITKKYNPTLIMTSLMFKDLPYLEKYDNIQILFDDIDLGDIQIQNIKTSHDASDSRGYIITEGDSSIVNITDTGYINQKNFSKISNKSLYIMESNHDVEMLMHGHYPGWLKKRMLSDTGHLSNEASSYYLSKIIGNNTKMIILAHLSEENNTPELALNQLRNTLKENNIEFSNIIAAKPKEKTELIEVW